MGTKGEIQALRTPNVAFGTNRESFAGLAKFAEPTGEAGTILRKMHPAARKQFHITVTTILLIAGFVLCIWLHDGQVKTTGQVVVNATTGIYTGCVFILSYYRSCSSKLLCAIQEIFYWGIVSYQSKLNSLFVGAIVILATLLNTIDSLVKLAI